MDSTASETIALVTGANAGMGYATCVNLLARGWRVIALCRDAARGQAALERMQAESGSAKAELVLADLGDLAAVQAAVAGIRARHDRLDVLINNAGVITTSRQEAVCGHELQFAVNHLGHFVLTLGLLPLLRAAVAARVVVVSSGAHKIGRIHADPDLHRGYSAFKAYAQSKLATLLFGLGLHRRLAGCPGNTVSVHICHPGAVGTSIGVDRQSGAGAGLMGFLARFFRTPAQGAATALWLATAPDLAGQSGGYWVDCRPARMSRRARRPEEAEALWRLSEELTGQRFA